MGRFYVELVATVYADSDDEALEIAQRMVESIPASDEVGGVEVTDCDEDEGRE